MDRSCPFCGTLKWVDERCGDSSKHSPMLCTREGYTSALSRATSIVKGLFHKEWCTITRISTKKYERFASAQAIIENRCICYTSSEYQSFRRSLQRNTFDLLRIAPHVIEVQVITGKFSGSRAFLPRISSNANLPFVLKRRQFPIQPAFAMTINKAQGQTLNYVGVYLPTPVFLMANFTLLALGLRLDKTSRF